jgi:hypothetical protein
MAWSATLAATVAVGIGVAMAKAERERRAARELVPEHERRFGLLTGETAAHGLRRIALGQLELAIELLADESDVPPERAVHETRKALKRMRALLRLVEGEIGRKRAERERSALRDAAKRLAGARDAEVMVETFDALIARQPRKLGRKRALLQLREHLRRERRAASIHAREDAAARAEVARELRALRARVRKWELPDRAAKKLTGAGLEHIYRAGRNGCARAGARKSNSQTLHKWRKHAKDLRYALEVLDVGDPPDRAPGGSPDRTPDTPDRTPDTPDRTPGSPNRTPGRARGEASRKRSEHADRRIAELARRADALGELLGEEHDLTVLAERVRAHKPLKRHKRARRQLLRAISRRRAKLRKRALRKGGRLYERKPQRFVRRVHASLRA